MKCLSKVGLAALVCTSFAINAAPAQAQAFEGLQRYYCIGSDSSPPVPPRTEPDAEPWDYHFWATSAQDARDQAIAFYKNQSPGMEVTVIVHSCVLDPLKP